MKNDLSSNLLIAFFILSSTGFIFSSSIVNISVLDDDAGIISLNSPSIPFESGIIDVNITLNNFGENPLVSANINWEVNGILQPVYNWTGNLSPGSDVSIDIGNYDFLPLEAYNIKAWTTLPNGNPDSQIQNDSIEVDGLYPSLSGDYTLGGATPDFTTFQKAVDQLHISGISDTVRFLVRSGTYTEQILINEFPGSDCTLPVIFQSETGDSSDVVLTFDNIIPEENYTVYLNGADGIEFQSITLEASDFSNAIVVKIDNEANCNTLNNCHLIGSTSTSNISYTSTINRSLIFSNSSDDNNNSFTNSVFENGSYGLYLNGAGPINLEGATTIEGCTFLNNFLNGARLYYQSNLNFHSNKISSNTTANIFYGLYLYNSKFNIEIVNNNVNIPSNGIGFYLKEVEGSSGNEGLIANNFIAVGSAVSGTGIIIDDNNYMKFYHNNIHIYNLGTNPGTGATFRYNENIEVKNNLFVNSVGGYAIYHIGHNSSNVFDYNNLYTTGSNLAFWNGDREDLNAYQTISGQEEYSLSVDPLYNSNEDLHINKALLDGAGTSVIEVPNDFDDEARMNPPDIGADEFTPTGTNAGLSFLGYPMAPFSSDIYGIQVAIQNTGANELTSATLQWKVNDVTQTAYNYSGSLMTGQKDTVTIGMFDFLPLVSHNITTWVEDPNGGSDIDSSDDTLSVNSVYSGLAGNYTIGGISPDFSIITNATDALLNGGILDSVSFSIRSGTYNEVIDLYSFPGNDCDVPVIFESETGDSSDVIITYPLSTVSQISILNLDGADGMVFKNLTFDNTGTGGIVIKIQNEANCNSFLNNRIIGSNELNSNHKNSIIYSPSTNDTCNVFYNNLLENGSYGINLSGTASSPSPHENGTVIKNNQLVNNFITGFELSYQSNPTIIGNSIITNTINTNFCGICLDYPTSGLTISDNKIIMSNGTYGINFDTYFGDAGISSLVSNNFISLGGSGTGYGIYLFASHVDFYHNSVNITKTSSYSSAFHLYLGGNLSIVNNAFVNTGGGYSIYSYVPTEIPINSNYNNLYTTGPVLGHWDGDQTTLSNWQAASGKDANSVSLDPVFVSDTDLHLTYLSPQNKGIALPDITHDIDGDLRDISFPNIGADEYLCPDKLSLQNEILSGILTIRASTSIDLNNVTFSPNCQITMIAPLLNIANTSKVESLGILNYIQQNGCN